MKITYQFIVGCIISRKCMVKMAIVICLSAFSLTSGVNAGIYTSSQGADIIVHNDGQRTAYWVLCIRKSGGGFADRPSGVTAAGGTSLYRMWLQDGESAQWQVAWSEGGYPTGPNC